MAPTVTQADEASGLFVRIDNDLFTGTDREYTSGVQVGSTIGHGRKLRRCGIRAEPPLGQRQAALASAEGVRREQRHVDDRPAHVHARGLASRGPRPARQTLRGPAFRRPHVQRPGLAFAAFDVARRRHRRALRPRRANPKSRPRTVGADQFLGWDHQLNDEPVFRILHERFRRWDIQPARRFGDVTAHYGGSIGNLSTFANAGAELRIGKSLPDNFGTATTLAYGQDTAPTRWGGSPSRLSIHGFVAVDARVVLHDITLDGNTWRDSASVDREPYVAEIALGVALNWREWQATLGTVYRTKEYETQEREASFGTLTFRRALARR